MSRRLSVFLAGSVALALVGASTQSTRLAAAAGQNQDSSVAAAAQYRAVLDKYCVTCHNERLRTAGLALNKLDLSTPGQDGETWEKVLGKIERRTMPPAGAPRPDEATYAGMAVWLASSLESATVAHPNPGRPAIHRLNRTEYANAIRDLFSLDVDVAALLPPDDSTHGFDNIADVLGVSPLLLESYVNAARKVSRVAVGDPAIPPVSQQYWVARDETQDYQKEGLPFGTRGGLRTRHTFPLGGEYEFRVRLSRNHADLVRGVQDPGNDVEFAIDGEIIKLFNLPGGKQMYAQEYFDASSPALTADDGLHLRIPVTAGPHDITVTFPVRTYALTEDLTKPKIRAYVTDGEFRGLPEISHLDVAGPFNPQPATDTPSRRRIFTCRSTNAEAADAACAKKIISQIARLAYRGLSTDADVQELLGFYNAARQRGGFEGGIEAAMGRMLASPKFIFRFEFDPPGVAPEAPYRVTDVDLASRLSFTLWSSIPDDQLLDVAARGELRTPAMLERQVRRMLADPRAHALVDNFAGQWLYLRNLESVLPDKPTFPNFDNNLRQAFRRETELLFETILREDRSVLDLLNADYTFVNERLARHYGIPNVRGSDFRRVSVSDENRRGILGHGSILTVTSYANRTSPVIRGKWVMENILGAPPPPPPPNVPDLPETKGEGSLSIRERMAQHRASPVCASCHKVMDPIGFGLENFDAVGGWRTTEGRAKIDSSGALPDGTPFEGPAGLRKSLMQHPEVFVNTVTGKLLTYALGRGLEYSDAPAVRAITREAARSNYAFSSIILGIVKSVPFQMKRAAEEPGPAAKTVAIR